MEEKAVLLVEIYEKKMRSLREEKKAHTTQDVLSSLQQENI